MDQIVIANPVPTVTGWNALEMGYCGSQYSDGNCLERASLAGRPYHGSLFVWFSGED